MGVRIVKRSAVSCLVFAWLSSPLYATENEQDLANQIHQLQQETQLLQSKLASMSQSLKSSEKKQAETSATSNAVTTDNATTQKTKKHRKKGPHAHVKPKIGVHDAVVKVHSLDKHPEKLEFYPAALIADNNIVTYIAGMPVVSSPYLGSRPAFDGSDYIVNISSINRDIRLMEQRRRLYRAFDRLDYPLPNLPVVLLSGKLEPLATIGRRYVGPAQGDVTLGANELDIAASLNDKVQAYMGIAYDASPPAYSGQRIANSSFNLNMGFVNIGDLDRTPFYFTAGQIYIPYGRYSTSMISPTLPMLISRTKNRPFILGYKSQTSTGPFAAIYGFTGDTTLGSSGVGGANLGYIFTVRKFAGEIGGSFVSSLNNAGGMQRTGSVPGTTFGGFGSLSNGSENVKKIPGFGAHTSISFERYNIMAEWVIATEPFRIQDLSFNGQGAQPQAAQLEGGVTFMSFNRPSSVGVGYQWTAEALALNVPQQRINAVYNISIWRDTIESIEYRHDIDYGKNQYANGAAPQGVVNQNTIGTGGASDTVLFQLGVYF